MAKVRKVNYDPNEVESGSSYVHHPAPALVRVKCVKADLDFTSSTGNDGVHMEFNIVGSKPPKKGQQWSTLHHYLTFTDAAQWREVEMMEALLGKRVKTYKESDLVGQICLAKLKPEVYEGEDQSKIARLLPLDEDEDDEEDDEPVADEDDDEEDEDEEESDDYNDWTLTQLRAELEARDLETTGHTKTLIKRLEADDESGDDDEPEPDEDATVDYSELTLGALRVEAKQRGITTRGLDKDALVEALEDDDNAEPESDDEDEDEDDDEDESVDYNDLSIRELRAACKERGIDSKGLDKDELVAELEADDEDPLAE